MNAFGQRGHAAPVRGGRGVRMEAFFVVPSISSVQNAMLDLLKGDYAHQKELWLSDVCTAAESFIDIQTAKLKNSMSICFQLLIESLEKRNSVYLWATLILIC